MPNPPTKEFPLRHRFGVHFNLQEYETSAANYRTGFPLFFADQAKTEALAQAVQVNPANDNYEGIKNSGACFMNSRINKIKISEYVYIPKNYDVPDMIYHKTIVSWGLGDYSIKDPVGGTLLTALGFTQSADTLQPTYTAQDLESGNLQPADHDGLDTTQQLETTVTIPESLRNALHGKMGAKARAMCIGPFPNRVHKEFPFFSNRWYDVPGRTKRMNAFTGCYLFVAVELALGGGASAADTDRLMIHFQDELTIDEDALSCHYILEFNEYNDSFDNHA